MEGGPPMFKQDFKCPVLLKININFYPYRAITYYGLAFQLILVINMLTLAGSAFARHY